MKIRKLKDLHLKTDTIGIILLSLFFGSCSPPTASSNSELLPGELSREFSIGNMHYLNEVPRSSSSPEILQISGATLGEVNQKIQHKFENAGYSNLYHMAAPNGFAIATPLERITKEGKPQLVDRWVQQSGAIQKFTVGGYFKALLTADPGFYRVFLIVVSDENLEGKQPASRDQMKKWANEGAASLSKPIQKMPYDPKSYSAKSYVYEFQRPRFGNTASLSHPSDHSCREHLERSGISLNFD